MSFHSYARGARLPASDIGNADWVCVVRVFHTSLLTVIFADLSCQCLQDTQKPTWSPATIFLVTNRLHHLLVQNMYRRERQGVSL